MEKGGKRGFKREEKGFKREEKGCKGLVKGRKRDLKGLVKGVLYKDVSHKDVSSSCMRARRKCPWGRDLYMSTHGDSGSGPEWHTMYVPPWKRGWGDLLKNKERSWNEFRMTHMEIPDHPRGLASRRSGMTQKSLKIVYFVDCNP